MARAELDKWLSQREATVAWKDLWEELQGERVPMIGSDGELVLNERGEARVKRRWNWRQALTIAWYCVPAAEREPPTLEGLAKLLGLKSTAAIRNWRRRDPEFIEAPHKLLKQRLVQYLVDVDAAHIAVATTPDPRATSERRLFYERIGELGQGGATAVAVALSGSGLVPLAELVMALRKVDETDDESAGDGSDNGAGGDTPDPN